MSKRMMSSLLAAVLLCGGVAWAQMGPGMMGDYGPGYGMGPGIMGW